MPQDYSLLIIDMINSASRAWKASPLVLGGVPTSSGGGGGPPGGFVGWLPQKRVAYDTAEISSSGIPASGASLYDNLNHIRYRIDELENASGTGGGHVIRDVSTSYTQRGNLKFLGGVTVVDDAGSDSTVVTIASSSGSLSSQAETTLFGRAVGAGAGTPGALTPLESMKILATEFGGYDPDTNNITFFSDHYDSVPGQSLNVVGNNWPTINIAGFEETYPQLAGYYNAGPQGAEVPAVSGDYLLSIYGAGRSDIGLAAGAYIDFIVDEDWIYPNLRTKLVFSVTGKSYYPQIAYTIHHDSVDIPSGNTYNINGIPHTHTGTGSIPLLTSDPVSPSDGDLWLLRETASGISDGIPMGFMMMFTYTDSVGGTSALKLSVNDNGTTRRLQFV